MKHFALRSSSMILIISVSLILMSASSGPYGQAVSNLEDNYIIANPNNDNSENINWLCKLVPGAHFQIINQVTNETVQKGETNETGDIDIRRLESGEYFIIISFKPERAKREVELKKRVEFDDPIRIPLQKTKNRSYRIYTLEAPAHVFTLIRTWHYKLVFQYDAEKEIKLEAMPKVNFREANLKIAKLSIPKNVKTTDIKCKFLRIY